MDKPETSAQCHIVDRAVDAESVVYMSAMHKEISCSKKCQEAPTEKLLEGAEAWRSERLGFITQMHDSSLVILGKRPNPAVLLM